MLLTESTGIRLQLQAQRTPFLAFTAVDVPALAEQIRAALFPAIADVVRCFFVNGPTLGCVYRDSVLRETTIFVHDLLNRSETPEPVFRHVLTHELIHLVVPPREIQGKLKSHPPEFWEAERYLSPGGDQVWSWLWGNFWSVLREDTKKECVRVRRDWRRQSHSRVLTWEETIAL